MDHNGTVFKGKKPEKVAYIKTHVASRILSRMEKGTPLHEETLPLSSESDVEERTVGSETSFTFTSSSEFRPIIISDNRVLHTVVTSMSR